MHVCQFVAKRFSSPCIKHDLLSIKVQVSYLWPPPLPFQQGGVAHGPA